MKNLLLYIIASGLVISAMAQKPKKNNVSYTYLRQPITNLDQSLSYKVISESTYKAEEDHKKAEYSAAVQRAQLDYEYMQNVIGDTAYQLRTVTAPKFLPVISDMGLESQVSFDGFSRDDENGDMAIKVTYHKFEYQVNRQTIPGTDGGETKYKITYQLLFQIDMQLMDENGNELWSQTVAREDKKTHSYKSQSSWASKIQAYENNKSDNLTKYVKAALSNGMNKINYTYGYSNVGRKDIIFSAKKNKNFDFTDLNTAAIHGQDALAVLTNNYDDAKSKIISAISEWDNILKEASADKKAKINPEVAAAIRLNKALCFTHLKKYADAEASLNKVLADTNNKRKFKKEAEDLKGFLADEKKRNN